MKKIKRRDTSPEFKANVQKRIADAKTSQQDHDGWLTCANHTGKQRIYCCCIHVISGAEIAVMEHPTSRTYEGLGYLLCAECNDPTTNNDKITLICEGCGRDIMAKFETPQVADPVANLTMQEFSLILGATDCGGLTPQQVQRADELIHSRILALPELDELEQYKAVMAGLSKEDRAIVSERMDLFHATITKLLEGGITFQSLAENFRSRTSRKVN